MKITTDGAPPSGVRSAQSQSSSAGVDVPAQPSAGIRAVEYVTKWRWPVMVGVSSRPRAQDGRFAGGVLEASVDVDRVRGWWREHPEAGVVSLTGAAFDVLVMPLLIGRGCIDALTAQGVWLGPIMANSQAVMFLIATGQGERWREVIPDVGGYSVLCHGEPVCLPPGNPAAGQVVRWVVPPTVANARVLPTFELLVSVVSMLSPSVLADRTGRS